MKSYEMQIALVRSCPTQWDHQKRLTGTQDIPLCEDGREAALQIAGELGYHTFAAIVAAPCLAARQTAEIVGEALGLRVRIDNQLQNVDLGLWEGRQLDELKTCQPKMLRNWQEAPDLLAPPEGETTDPVRKRIYKSLRRWVKKYQGQRIVLIVPEPLASVVKSEWEQAAIEDLKEMTDRSGKWEWLEHVRMKV